MTDSASKYSRWPWIILVVTVLFVVGTGCSKSPDSNAALGDRVLVLGFDGMDALVFERLLREGKLPNFQSLMAQGSYSRLGTTIPPESPVAWSSFITGMNPGGHGIFDFIHRDPNTMIPYLSTSRTEDARARVRLGNWVFPLSGVKVSLLRKGKSFWEILEENGIPTTIFRIPANFPPVETSARQFSGMGTPDLQGTYGMFAYFTEEDPAAYPDVSGGRVIPVNVFQDTIQTALPGPLNTFRKDPERSQVDFTIHLDPDSPLAEIRIQDQTVLLKEGEWSDWVSVEFDLLPMIKSAKGICRFYLKEVRPRFKLYVSPINIDPASPAVPIATPEDYSKQLADRFGPFYTQGIPEDSKALSEGILNKSEFLEQTRLAFEEQVRIFEYELARFNKGLLFYYFGRVDQLQHMFWADMDPEHRRHDPSSPYSHVIEDAYGELDGVLGKALGMLDGKTTLVVLSDHGFAPFSRAFSLNTWLKNEGYVRLTNEEEGEFFENVDWSGTSAYGLGFAGLYINTKGRERQGIVSPGTDREHLIQEISEKLLALKDPETGERFVADVYRTEDVYSGPYTNTAPDLIVGYRRGYRASWESVLGKFPKEILRDNEEEWSGDHLMAAEEVPGILVTNRKIEAKHPALADLAPTILSLFGLPVPDDMVGRKVF